MEVQLGKHLCSYTMTSSFPPIRTPPSAKALSTPLPWGTTSSTPIVVSDNVNPVDELQPNLNVADNGVTDTVSVAFYDRRLSCPAAGTAEAIAAGIGLDPGTGASPGTT